MSGHYGELVFGQKRKIDILFSPMIYSLNSFLHGHVAETPGLSARDGRAGEHQGRVHQGEGCLRRETGFVMSRRWFALAEPALVPQQLYESLRDVLEGLTLEETREAVAAGYRTLAAFNARDARAKPPGARMVRARGRPCILVLARPYHMDPASVTRSRADLQAYGYPILWLQYFPTDPDLMDWIFGDDIRDGYITSPFDIGTSGRHPTAPIPMSSCGAPRSRRGFRGSAAPSGSRATSAGWISRPSRRCSRSSSAPVPCSSRSRS